MAAASVLSRLNSDASRICPSHSRNDRFLENAHPFHREPHDYINTYTGMRHYSLILFTRLYTLLLDTCVSLTSKYRYYLIATEYENVAQSSTFRNKFHFSTNWVR
jgi:hypothetical protein